MLAKMGRFVLAVTKGALLTIGAAVVALVWWFSSGDGKPKEGGPGPVPVAAVEKQAGPDAGCACASGVLCTGPRGGQYCLDADGKKKYRAQQ